MHDKKKFATVTFSRPVSFTVQHAAYLLENVLEVVDQKNAKYGDAWKRQGWMGNLARIMSKSDRLRSMLWRPDPVEDSDESVKDTALDIVALAVFFAINFANDNPWGDK